MIVDAWRLPWGSDTVPHGLLDINRGCNISCDACYNSAGESVRSLREVEEDLTTMLAHRRLASVSIIGGEVLLHPGLCDVIRLVKAHGLFAEIFTNGLLLDDRRLSEMKEAGLDLVFVHIDSGQTRPDLPPKASADELRQLWEAKTSLIARHGIDAGLTMTAFDERINEVRDMVTYVIRSPRVNYVLVTLFRDMTGFAEIRGDLSTGMTGKRRDPNHHRTDTLDNVRMATYLCDELGLRPFAYVPSNRDPDDPRWLSYLVTTRQGPSGGTAYHSMKASLFERLFLTLSLRFAGRYPMYRRQSASQLVTQMLLNGLTGGDFSGNARFLLRSCHSGARLGAKRLLFQYPAEIDANGTVVHCLNCPDAVVRHGKLVPVCIADYVSVTQ